MDAKAKPEKVIEDAMMKLKIDPPSKASSINMSGPKGANQSDSTSCISSADATCSIKESDVDQEASVGDQGMHYYGYYYPGSTGCFGDLETQCRNPGPDNFQIEHHAIQADNGSVVYYLPGFQPGYNTYGSFLPGAIYGVDGQYLGQWPYYPSPQTPQPVVSPGLFPQPVAYGTELVPAYHWDPSLFFPNEIQGSTFTGNPKYPLNKPNLPSHGHNFAPPRTTTSKGTSLTSDVSHPTAAPIPTHKPVKKMASAVPTKGYVPVNKYNTCANQGKGTLLYSKSPIGLKEDGRSWIDDEKLKVRNQLSSSGDLALLNEQNRGPRTNGSKPSSQSGDEHFDSLSVEKNDNGSSATAFLIEDDYNLPDFQTKYEHALFFIIKSYSEDDIHKSIKYNVWASTPNGNKRLDNAFQVAQQMIAEKDIKCPVFLFFSVNASGQFCGVAEMIGRVDFSKNMDFWQQDKWNGYFPVKWHIIKDVPNPQFRHIILENNDNKPVTNSRDTQEVKVSQGSEMLNIFKSYSSKTSILDDFGFYENRQKAMQEKRNKPANPAFNHPLPKHVEPTQVQKPGDSKSLSPNPASGNVKEDLQPSIATTK